jgi:hypothetical protein
MIQQEWMGKGNLPVGFIRRKEKSFGGNSNEIIDPTEIIP